MIEFHPGLEVARKIVERLTDDLKMMTLEHSYTVSNYVNGREVGHSINWYDFEKEENLSISFAENRNSDNIVIYYGKKDGDFSISESAYANKVYLGYGEVEEAVLHIRKILIEEDEKHVNYINSKEFKNKMKAINAKF